MPVLCVRDIWCAIARVQPTLGTNHAVEIVLKTCTAEGRNGTDHFDTRLVGMRRLGGSPGRSAGCTAVGMFVPAFAPAPAVVLSTISEAKAGSGATVWAVVIQACTSSRVIPEMILAR